MFKLRYTRNPIKDPDLNDNNPQGSNCEDKEVPYGFWELKMFWNLALDVLKSKHEVKMLMKLRC